MKQKRKRQSHMYVYAHGFESGTLHRRIVWKKALRMAAEPGAADGPESGRKRRAKHEAEGTGK